MIPSRRWKMVIETDSEGALVAVGGSVTLGQIGLLKTLGEGGEHPFADPAGEERRGTTKLDPKIVLGDVFSPARMR